MQGSIGSSVAAVVLPVALAISLLPACAPSQAQWALSLGKVSRADSYATRRAAADRDWLLTEVFVTNSGSSAGTLSAEDFHVGDPRGRAEVVMWYGGALVSEADVVAGGHANLVVAVDAPQGTEKITLVFRPKVGTAEEITVAFPRSRP